MKHKDSDPDGLFDFRDYVRSRDEMNQAGWNPGFSIKGL
jgi:hypothetical protein